MGVILGDPGADSGGEGKSKRAGKYGTKKSKEWQVGPLGTMSYQTSSQWLPSDWCQKTCIFSCILACFFLHEYFADFSCGIWVQYGGFPRRKHACGLYCINNFVKRPITGNYGTACPKVIS